MFKTSVSLEELKKYSSDVYYCGLKASKIKTEDLDFIRVDRSEFLKCPDDSVDYAVMEHTDKAVVLLMDVGWSNVGSWSTLWEISEKDSAGSVIHGDAITSDTECYIYAPNKLVASAGVKDIVVVETKDAILVAHKDNVQKLKKVVEHLKAENRAEYRERKEVYCPWGESEAIDGGKRYQVNRITIQPGKKQSLQLYYHRAEHWVVVSGTAKVRSYGQDQIIKENQSLYIPIRGSHMVENPGEISLELIEIQSGSYLNEEDVVLLEESK